MTPAGWVMIAERMPPAGQPVWLWGPGEGTPPMALAAFNPGVPGGPPYMRATWSHLHAEQSYTDLPGFTHWHPVEQPAPPA